MCKRTTIISTIRDRDSDCDDGLGGCESACVCVSCECVDGFAVTEGCDGECEGGVVLHVGCLIVRIPNNCCCVILESF